MTDIQTTIDNDMQIILGSLAEFQTAKAEKAQIRQQWESRFERRDWVAPYDCAGGLKQGDAVLGWVCPACGEVEINEFILHLNHGYHPYIVGDQPHGVEFGETCHKQRLNESQRRSAERRAKKAMGGSHA